MPHHHPDVDAIDAEFVEVGQKPRVNSMAYMFGALFVAVGCMTIERMFGFPAFSGVAIGAVVVGTVAMIKS